MTTVDKMTNIADKLKGISKDLESLAQEIGDTKPYPFSKEEIDKLVCIESASMIRDAYNHLTQDITR